MTASERLLARVADPATHRLRVLAASGQLGYGIPCAALHDGLAAGPDVIGCDMGSIDPGPYYLGSGRMATSPELTRRDLELVLRGALALGAPLIIGSAGTAGARPHVDATLELVEAIAREHALSFRLAVIYADIDGREVHRAHAAGRLAALGPQLALRAEDIDATPNIVAQMGVEPIILALREGADVIVTGRACDTAIFAAAPLAIGYPPAPTMHMAKIIECTSICCEPGGRDAMLGILDTDGFELCSMNPERHATEVSVAAHALYEQADPFEVIEPSGRLRIDTASYQALDDHRCRVSGARFEPAPRPSLKLEGARPVGQRAVVVAGASDPAFIEQVHSILKRVEDIVRGMIPGQYSIHPRVYGIDGVSAAPAHPPAPREVGLVIEVIAHSDARAIAVAGAFKQHLLHHGFPGRMSTGGNLAFAFTPPEIPTGSAYRFSIYHVMAVDDACAPFRRESRSYAHGVRSE